MKTATVCILTFNGEEFLDQLLDQVTNQVTEHSYDVLVIDSGSTDGTLEICKRYPDVRLIEIDNSEFGHGKTRNLAVQESDSEFVLFLTQDAVPATLDWLEAMVEPFLANEKISCVFGKQIPRPDCVVSVKREIDSVFAGFGGDGSWSVQRKSHLVEKNRSLNQFFSDVNSAVRKSAVLEIPFRDIEYAEDHALASDHMNNGWYKCYAPLGVVFHSHDYPPKKYFQRKIDERIGAYKSIGELVPMSRFKMLKRTATGTIRDWIYIARDRDYSATQKLANVYKAPIYNYLLCKCLLLTSDPSRHESLQQHSLHHALRSKA